MLFRSMYDLDIDIWSNGGCNNDNNQLTLTDAIIVAEPPAPLSKSLVSGPLESSTNAPPPGCDGTNACDGFAIGYDIATGPNNAGAVGLTLGFSQHYAVEILIANVGINDAINGNVITDTFGADFDLDPIAEEDWAFGGFPLTGVCSDGICNGVDFDGIVVNGNCSYTASQPPNPSGNKEPEFIDIIVNDLDAGEECSVLVFVQTVENPGDGNDFWEPTGCRILTEGDDIQDTFTLNEGLKEFAETGERLQGLLTRCN